MKKHLYSFISILAVLTLVSCGGNKKQENRGPAGPTKVITVKLPTRDITTYNRFSTRIEGIINTEARPKISGYITEVYIDEGQKVRKGQVLFKLETASLNEEAAAAQANIHAAQVQVDQLSPLVEKNIVSANQLATAKARLSQAKAAYQGIAANIGYATVKSPVDGYVGEIRIRKGNLVSPNDPTPLTTVTDISKVYAYFSMSERNYLNFLKSSAGETRDEKIENMPEVTLIMANGDEYPTKGKIETINSQIDKRTGTISIRAIFDNKEQYLTNGSTGEIKIPSVYKDALIVPQNATYLQQDKIYLVKAEQTDSGTVAVVHPFTIKDNVRNFYIVDGGAKKGDEIVAVGVEKLRSGTLIEPDLKAFDSIIKPVTVVYEK